MRIPALTWAVCVAAIGAGCEPFAGPPQGPDPIGESRAAHAPRPAGSLARQDRRTKGTSSGTTLPAVVRDALRERMDRHADSMQSLLWSSLQLDYRRIAERSEWVLAEPRITRPGESDDQDLVNRVLPRRFFDLQDELHRQAGELRRAALRRDDEGIARAYGQMADTCIRCHSLYLRLPESKASP